MTKAKASSSALGPWICVLGGGLRVYFRVLNLRAQGGHRELISGHRTARVTVAAELCVCADPTSTLLGSQPLASPC